MQNNWTATTGYIQQMYEPFAKNFSASISQQKRGHKERDLSSSSFLRFEKCPPREKDRFSGKEKEIFSYFSGFGFQTLFTSFSEALPDCFL